VTRDESHRPDGRQPPAGTSIQALAALDAAGIAYRVIRHGPVRSGGRHVPMAVRRQRVTGRAERLADAGATRLRVLEQDGMDHFAIVMQDPEGNEFCVH
jgi:Glyoxalase-like domain